MTRTRLVRTAAGVLVVLLALLAVVLGALEREGPAHQSVSIDGGIPGTLYLPEDYDDGDFPYQKPPGERPPVVVIAHGYSADQAIMSPLARSLAEAGYAALTFDFRGHGSNTKRFEGDLSEDFSAALDWAERSPQVDGSRIAILGHSMGAGAALDFATRDDRPIAVVPLSGGFQVNDAVVPDNVLLMAAEGDPSRILDRQAEIAGDLRARTDANVVTSEIAGKNHITILFSNTAIEEIIAFLDPILDVERSPAASPGLDDGRLGPAALYALLAFVAVGFIGLATARYVEPAAEAPAPLGGLLLLAGALLVTAPIMASGGINVLPIGAGQPIVVQTLLAAALLWALRALVRRGELRSPVSGWIGHGPWLPARSVVWPGVATAVAIVVLFTPLAGVTHRLVPTPARLVLWVVMSAMALPFFAAFEGLVRRGGTWQAIGWGLAGRLLIVVSLLIGIGAGLLPPVIGLVIPLLVLQYLLLELFAATCFAKGRNPAVIAVVESVLIAWFAVTLTPIG